MMARQICDVRFLCTHHGNFNGGWSGCRNSTHCTRKPGHTGWHNRKHQNLEGKIDQHWGAHQSAPALEGVG